MKTPLHLGGEPHQDLPVLAQDPDLQRPRVPGQIVQDVLEDLHELDPHARHLPIEARAHPIDDLFRVGAAPAWLQQNGDVAAVELGRGDRSELGARPAGPVHDGRRLTEDRLDAQSRRIGRLEGGSGRKEVVEDERALVHLGQEPRRDA